MSGSAPAFASDALPERKSRMTAVEPRSEAEALYHLMMGWVEARLIEERRPDTSEVDRLEAFAMAGLARETEPAGGRAAGPEPEPTPSPVAGDETNE